MPIRSFIPRAETRLATGTVVAAAIGGAWLGPATTIHAQPSPSGAGGITAPSGSPGAIEAPGSTGQRASTPCTTPSLHLRCPDLIMSAPYNLHVDRSTIPGRVLLRAASSLNNRGSGPLEIRAHRGGSHLSLIHI